MATTPLVSSPPSSIKDLQQYWLNHSTQAFINHLNTTTDLPICIFQLPETLTSQKPDSYIPHRIGLGPIHHFRTDLYCKQQQLKITTSKSFLKPYKITPEFPKIVHEKLTHLVPVVRSCYELYFDITDECLSWMFVVDSLFLLDVLSTVADGYPSEFLEDVIMLENQIPVVILVNLLTVLHQEHSMDDSDESFLMNLLIKFCETRSPLKFTTPETELNLELSYTYHLLDCMHHLIVTHNLPPYNPSLRSNVLLDVNLEDVENAAQMAQGLFPGLNAFLQPVLLVLKLPWDKIMSFVKKLLGENPTMLEIDIPSVSKLTKIGKIEFFSTPGGIHDIKFDEEKPSIALPILDLKFGSEVVLRNLVAYEELMFKKDNISNLYFTEYVDLMCGIIDGVIDVKILREKNIIEGDMNDEDIVNLFNGITKSSVETDGMKSGLQKTIRKVNTFYGNIPRVKVVNFIKRLFLASWKILAIVFSVVSLGLMIITGVCQVYDCKGRFGLGHVWSVLDFVNRDNQFVDF